ncbi:MAG TPA: helix-turn-helix transcriptional regulator [Candidatus Limnocylindria bacterium]|jgi:molybdopterin-binding protein
MDVSKPRNERALRIGEAAEILGVSVDTLRRWAETGALRTTRSGGGQRLVSAAEVRRLLGKRRAVLPLRPVVAQSARNRFAGIVTKVRISGVAATVEIQAGPHRLVSLMTAEGARELKLRPGDEAICIVKATNVIVEVPS